MVQHRRGKPTQQAIRKYNEPYFRELIWTLEDRARQMMMALGVLHKLTQASHRFTCRGRPHAQSCLPRHHSREPGKPSSHLPSLGLSGSGRHDKIFGIPPLSTHWHRSSRFLNPFHGIRHHLFRCLDLIRKLTQGESLTFFSSLNPTNPIFGESISFTKKKKGLVHYVQKRCVSR